MARFSAGLAGSLNNLAGFLSYLGRRGEALKAAEEAVQTLTPHFLALRPAFAQWRGTTVRNYVQRCADLQREPDSSLLEPILKALQELKKSGQRQEWSCGWHLGATEDEKGPDRPNPFLLGKGNQHL